jgi:hypothetical protein
MENIKKGDNMKILAIERDAKEANSENFRRYLESEALKVWELYQEGIIREIYFRGDKNSAILILECKNIHEAKTVLSTLPLVKENLIGFDIIPLVPYPGFERLFKRE